VFVFSHFLSQSAQLHPHPSRQAAQSVSGVWWCWDGLRAKYRASLPNLPDSAAGATSVDLPVESDLLHGSEADGTSETDGASTPDESPGV